MILDIIAYIVLGLVLCILVGIGVPIFGNDISGSHSYKKNMKVGLLGVLVYLASAVVVGGSFAALIWAMKHLIGE